MGKLEEYRKKRRFDKTKEPSRRILKRKRKALIFVVQRHWARTEHYDFRLEIGSVLESWAIPKGPPLKPGIKRLAIITEPHPIAYADWEGTIPEGLYGAGKVEIWDKGTYTIKEKNTNRIVFQLHGKKLTGEYSLIRFRPPKEWLLVKNKR